MDGYYQGIQRMDEKKARNIVKKYINFLRKNKLNIEKADYTAKSRS